MEWNDLEVSLTLQSGETRIAGSVNFFQDALMVANGVYSKVTLPIDDLVSLGLRDCFNEAFKQYRHPVTKKPQLPAF